MSVDLASVTTVVCIYVIMAVSLYLPLALGDLFLLPIGTMGFGAYTYGYLATQHVPIPLSVAGALATGTAIGAVIGWFVLRLRGLGSALVTLGVIEIISVFFQNFDPFGAAQGMTGVPALGSVWSALALAVLAIAAVLAIEAGRRGNIMYAVEKDLLAAECLGFHTRMMRFGMNVCASVFSTIAGIMLAGYLSFVSPDQFGLSALNRYLMATIMGGTTTVLGPVVGGFIAGGIPQFIQFLQSYQVLIFSAFVIMLLLVRKQGLVTRRDVRRLFRQHRSNAEATQAALPQSWQGLTLRASGISKAYGGLHVLSEVAFVAESGRVLGIIGPNGAGKTTLLNILSGVIAADGGTLELGDKPVHFSAPHQAVRSGIARTFQNLRLFAELTVEENLTIVDPHLTGALLALTGLSDARDARAGALPYGKQRRLEIARALALRPRVLLLDEPTAGMTHEESEEVAAVIRQLAARGLTIVLIEHNLHFLRTVAQHAIVLDAGRLIASGSCDAVLAEPAVVEAYIGKPLERAAAS